MYSITSKWLTDETLTSYLNALDSRGLMLVSAHYIRYDYDQRWKTGGDCLWKIITKQKSLEHHQV